MHVLNPLVRRRSWLLALATLTALLALAAAALASQQARAQTVSDVSLALSIAGESDNIVPANGQAITVNLSASYSGEDALSFNLYDVTLRVSGSLEWDANGRSSLKLIEDVDNNGDNGNALEVGPITDTEVADTNGEANRVICARSELDGDFTWRCALNAGFLGDDIVDDDGTADIHEPGFLREADADADPAVTAVERKDDPDSTANGLDDDDIDEADTSITIARGTEDGMTFTISVSAKIRSGATDAATDRTLSATLPVEVGTVDEVETVSLAAGVYRPDATSSDTRSYPLTITQDQQAVGTANQGETALMLSILNANGKASAAGSVASVLVTSSQGNIRSSLGCAGDAASLACQIPQGDINATNAATIFIYVKHPGGNKSGSSNIRASVLSTAGANLTTETVTVTFAGPIDKLELSEPTGGVLNVGTDADTRDQLTVSVMAKDASGNDVAVPDSRRTWSVKGPDNRNATSAFTGSSGTDGRDWTLRDSDGDPINDKANKPQARITVNRAANNKLAAGEYTLSVKAGSKTATQKFTVSGDVETIAVSDPEGDLNVNGRITVTATVTDAEGNAVPDGTVVTFAAAQAGTVPVLVQVSSDSRTRGGMASGSYLVVGSGTGWISVGAGGKSGIKLISIASPTAAPSNPADNLSLTTPDAFSTWLGETKGTASELLAALPGISRILLYQNRTWLWYGTQDGRELPGSYDFELTRGAILWLSR